MHKRKKLGLVDTLGQRGLRFFIFSQEILQNGQNASKKGQNTTFFTPGGQNMKLWNENQFFESLKLFLTENDKTEAFSPSVMTRHNFYLLCEFFLFSQEILQNGRNASKNCQNSTFFTPGGQNMKVWNKSQFF